MARMVLTRAMAYAAGHDAGNNSMRKAERTAWNVDDFNAAAEKTNALLAHLPVPSLDELVTSGKPRKSRMERINRRAL